MADDQPGAPELAYAYEPIARTKNIAMTLAMIAVGVGAICALADVAYLVSYSWGGPRITSPSFTWIMKMRIFAYPICRFFTDSMMLVTGIALLARSRFAWNLAIAYLCAMMISPLMNFVLSILEPISRGYQPAWAMFMQAAYQGTSSLSFLVFALAALLLITRPTVRRLFDDLTTSELRPPPMPVR